MDDPVDLEELATIGTALRGYVDACGDEMPADTGEKLVADSFVMDAAAAELRSLRQQVAELRKENVDQFRTIGALIAGAGGTVRVSRSAFMNAYGIIRSEDSGTLESVFQVFASDPPCEICAGKRWTLFRDRGVPTNCHGCNTDGALPWSATPSEVRE